MPQDNNGQDAQADGYYTEDAMGADELDLSFLDDDESADDTDAKKK
jgi:hypothetical protein